MRKKLLLIITALLISVKALLAQYSGFYTEGFEEEGLFPPLGWRTEDVLGDEGYWEVWPYFAHSGQFDAVIGNDQIRGEDWLIAPKFSVIEGDSLSFWLARFYEDFNSDSLSVLVSTTDSSLSSFTVSLFRT